MNRSFINKRTFDGFRKIAAQEYTHIYVIDLGGDVRDNPQLSGSKHNVFAIQTGVAIAFLIKKDLKKDIKAEVATILYSRRPEMETAREKLDWLSENKFKDIDFQRIMPDDKHNWTEQSEHEWEDFIPIADKETKLDSGDTNSRHLSIFKSYSTGLSTNRDSWVYDVSRTNLSGKMQYFITKYNSTSPASPEYDEAIKWSRNLKRRFEQGRREPYSAKKLVRSLYRPFVSPYLYDSALYVDEGGIRSDLHDSTRIICISGVGSSRDFQSLASDKIPSLDLLEKTQCLPLYRYSNRERIENVTDFALKSFHGNYKDNSLNREDIFHYVYAVLHHPAYREKYALNLKQEFPRIPFYDNFPQWVAWGRELMDLHIGFETVTPFPLKRKDIQPKNDTPEALKLAQKAKLKGL